MVEGSGFADTARTLMKDIKTISLFDVPHSPIPTALGHKTQILFGDLQGKKTIIWSGRIHIYEGYRILH